jgi:hypothetical protein
MQQFMTDWAAWIFREAGRNPADHLDGIREMAKIASFVRIWVPLAGIAKENGYANVTRYLSTFDGAETYAVLDDLYPTVMEMISKCERFMTPEQARKMWDYLFDEAFHEARDEYVEGVLNGDF